MQNMGWVSTCVDIWDGLIYCIESLATIQKATHLQGGSKVTRPGDPTRPDQEKPGSGRSGDPVGSGLGSPFQKSRVSGSGLTRRVSGRPGCPGCYYKKKILIKYMSKLTQ